MDIVKSYKKGPSLIKYLLDFGNISVTTYLPVYDNYQFITPKFIHDTIKLI